MNMIYDKENDLWHIVESESELDRVIDQAADMSTLAGLMAKSLTGADKKVVIDLAAKYDKVKADAQGKKDKFYKK
ncbi:MAG: hypothetical protein RO469_05475 [Thermincola sp.]|jgi:hypothetical protein|nr:hypothetical protein [Thermincola sp.]MDT3704731.1 hypothetical protein [Thermincola sp.]